MAGYQTKQKEQAIMAGGGRRKRWISPYIL
jgi:hypothetical protein